MKSSLPALALGLLLAACQPAPPAAPLLSEGEAPAASSATAVAVETRPAPPTTPADPFVVFTVTPLPAPTGTPTAVVPEMRVAARDGMPAILIPEGTVLMGGLDVHAENDELPGHAVRVGAFWLDQLEVTNGMYALCVEAGACPPPQRFSSQKHYSYFDNPEFRDYPVVQITWQNATTYCEWAERRLPSEAEWERAARGDDTRTYPWGDEPPGADHANFDNLIRDTSRVGSYAAGASPFGVLDMAGNVWEWTADVYDFDFYLTSPEVNPVAAAGPVNTGRRVIRGGSFQDVWVDLRVSNRGYELGPNPGAAYGTEESIGRSSVKIGFRCASDP